MSPMRLLLEGPDLPSLLEQIRTKYGPQARILEAEKIRRGGVAGFFAQERFCIQVEIPDAGTAPEATPSGRRALRPSVMDLVDQITTRRRAAPPPREDPAVISGPTRVGRARLRPAGRGRAPRSSR